MISFIDSLRLEAVETEVREDNTRLQMEAESEVVIGQLQCYSMILRLLQFNAVFVTDLFYIVMNYKSM